MAELNDLSATDGLDAIAAQFNGGNLIVFNHTGVPGRNAAAAGTTLVTIPLETVAFKAASMVGDEARALINGDGEDPEVFPEAVAVAGGAPTYGDLVSSDGTRRWRAPASELGLTNLVGGNIVEGATVRIGSAFYLALPAVQPA